MTACFGHAATYWHIVLAGWFALGVAYSMSVTPSGRLLKRSANAEDRPALFAAQFALSHGCWLICYRLVGVLGAQAGPAAAFVDIAAIAMVGTASAMALWSKGDPDVVPHSHDELGPDHPHLRETHGGTGGHTFVIDDLHGVWPKP